MATTVSGPVSATRDETFDGLTAVLTRTGGVVGFDSGAIAPDQFSYTTASGGVLTMPNLKPGQYKLSLFVPRTPDTSEVLIWEVTGRIQPDAGATITLEEFLDTTIGALTPTLVQQALDAAAAAELSAAEAALYDGSWPARTTASAAALVGLGNGAIGSLGGLRYQVDTTATGTASATNDLGVDGLVPYGKVWQVAHFGALDLTGGADHAPIIERAIEAATARRNVVLVVDPGLHRVDTQVDALFGGLDGTADKNTLTIWALGATITVPQANTTGGLKITRQRNFQRLRVYGLRFESQHIVEVGGAPAATNGGTAFEVTTTYVAGDPEYGVTDTADVLLRDVQVGSQVGGTGPAGRGLWANGIVVEGAYFPSLHGVHAHTWHADMDAPDTTKNYAAGDGIRASGCYLPRFVDCFATGRWDRNFSVVQRSGSPDEDFQFTGCYGTGGRVGLEIDMPDDDAQATKEPGGRISGGHFNGHQYGISIRNRQEFTIDGVLVYLSRLDLTGTTYADAAFIRLEDCDDWTVSNCNLPGGGHYTSISPRDCAVGVEVIGGSRDWCIHSNRIGHSGVGVVVGASSGTGGVIRDNQWEAENQAAPATGLTTKIIDNSGDVVGNDVRLQRTPSLKIGANLISGAGHDVQEMNVTRHGRLVTFDLEVEINSLEARTGTVTIDVPDLPVPAGNNVALSLGYTVSVATEIKAALFLPLTGEIALYKASGTGAYNVQIEQTDITANFAVRLSGGYIAE